MGEEQKVIGLMGGSGTGKSTVAAEFAKAGIHVIDGDEIARLVVKKGGRCLDELKAVFGDDIVDENGELKRKELGSRVFSDPEKLNDLNCIIHKYIKSEIAGRMRNSAPKPVLIDAAALIESGISRWCNVRIAVVAGKEVRADRIIKRDSIPLSEAFKRINAQKDDNFYIDAADFVIYNNDDLEELKEQARRIIDIILMGEDSV